MEKWIYSSSVENYSTVGGDLCAHFLSLRTEALFVKQIAMNIVKTNNLKPQYIQYHSHN